jgi:hypothetical protein
LKRRDHLEQRDTDGSITLKWILKKAVEEDVVDWTDLTQYKDK